ncbi:MAG: hypothetical protein KAI97_02695 [Gemmatimonadetes bacterium]|nr:hypothetical protein [Gemmatimonadota bacterium]
MTYIPLIILSLFFVNALFRYGREALRLNRLVNSGTTTQATVKNKERVEGSKKVVRYLVIYEFLNFRGEPEVHERELRSKFFDSVEVGDTIDILHERRNPENSYPLSQIQTDRKIAWAYVIGLIAMWVGAVVVVTR